jgi:hypothetical protein
VGSQTIRQKCVVSSNLVEDNSQETDQGLHAKISALAVAQDESYEDTPDDHPSQTVALSRLQILHSSQEMAAINEDF